MPPPHSGLFSQLFRLTNPPPEDAELLRRWIEQREEDAFTALVSRHGRMVYGVCRRVLGSSHDAEDVFQAVFLTLARKAGTLRHPAALPGWLHGVAVRLASKARAAAQRRRCDRGASAAEPADPQPDPLDALSARELLGLIDREIARLPEKYRLPLVLCDLEGQGQAEAAQRLGWTLGSLRGRLLRGRERLRTRLARRGIAPAVLTAVCLQQTADTSVLTASVSRLSVRFAACPASVQISPSVAALVQEGTRGLILAKLKFASVLLLAVTSLSVGAGLLIWPAVAPQPAEERAQKKPPAPPPNAKPQVRRDRVGDPLPPEALSRLGTIRFRHGGFIENLAFGPDGKTLVAYGLDRLRLWDTTNGKEIQRFPEGARAQGMALSPDGKLLAIRVLTDNPNKDESIALHEYATGRILRHFGDKKTPSSLFFSPDGKVLAASDWMADPDIELWESASGRRLHILKGHTKNVWSIAFSPDSKTLVSGSDDKTIRFWDTATGKELRQIKHNQGIGKITWSGDGKLFASIDTTYDEDKEGGGGAWFNDNQVRLWDTATGKELRQLTMPAKEHELDPKFKEGFRNLAFAPDGKSLLTGGDDGILRIWDAVTGKELRQFPGFAVCPGPFAFAPDKKTLAVVDGFLTIRLLDIASGKDRLFPPGHRARVSSISVTPDGQAVATMSQDGTLRLWEPATGRELHRRAAPANFSHFTRLRADGRTYLTFGPDKVHRLHDLARGEERAILRGHESRHPFALSPDGKTLVSVNADKTIRLLDPAAGKVRHTLTKLKRYVNGMAFTADGRTLVVWDDEKIVSVWDVATGQKLRQFPAQAERAGSVPAGGDFYTAALSPDGKLLAIDMQMYDPIAKRVNFPPFLLDTTTGKEVRRFGALKDGDQLLCFSPDGRSLAWGGLRDNRVHLGEIATGRVRRIFSGHRGGVEALAFSADGAMLVAGGGDTTALVWDLTGRLAGAKDWGKPLSNETLESHWKTLADEDAAAAFQAMQALAADPLRTVRYLRMRLHPVALVDEKRLRQWIADLESEQFAVREKATAELEKREAAALPAMRKALAAKPTLETRRRLDQLIEKQQHEEWSPSAEGLRTRRAVEVLERVGTAEAKELLTILANGAPGAWQTRDAKGALQRLVQRPGAK